MNPFEDPHAAAHGPDTHLEAYLDGDLSDEDIANLARMLAADPALQSELDLAREVKTLLPELDAPPCPPEVTQAVFRTTRRWAWADRPRQLRRRLSRFVGSVWQPALGLGLVAVVAVTTFLRPAPVEPPLSQEAEVQQALAEVQWTLAYLSRVGQQTGDAVRHTVLETGVVTPVQHALGSALDEEKN